MLVTLLLKCDPLFDEAHASCMDGVTVQSISNWYAHMHSFPFPAALREQVRIPPLSQGYVAPH